VHVNTHANGKHKCKCKCEIYKSKFKYKKVPFSIFNLAKDGGSFSEVPGLVVPTAVPPVGGASLP